MIVYTSIFNKGLFIDTHPLFDGESLNYGKQDLKVFIKVNDFEMCVVLVNGLFIPILSFNDKVLNDSNEDNKQVQCNLAFTHDQHKSLLALLQGTSSSEFS